MYNYMLKNLLLLELQSAAMKNIKPETLLRIGIILKFILTVT